WRPARPAHGAPPRGPPPRGGPEPIRRIESPPPPPTAPARPDPSPASSASPSESPPKTSPPAVTVAPERPSAPRPTGEKRFKKLRASQPAAEPVRASEPANTTVASAEPVKATEPAPVDGMKPEVRKLLDQAEEALGQNKSLEASRLVDQSFFIQKTPLGYAIQARAACQRKDVGGARAAFRNITEPQLKQIVLRTCVRQGGWLF